MKTRLSADDEVKTSDSQPTVKWWKNGGKAGHGMRMRAPMADS